MLLSESRAESEKLRLSRIGIYIKVHNNVAESASPLKTPNFVRKQ